MLGNSPTPLGHRILPISHSRPLVQNPTILVALLLGVQIIVWTLVPSLTHTSPPLDVVEGYMWGREWVLATYKHPALPSWALEATRLVAGAIGWPAYLLSQACVATTFLFVYLLGRELMGPARAAAGTLLLTGVVFYAWPTTEFNHNVAELPIWAAMAWTLWHAVKQRGIDRWVLLGTLAALSMYAKFASALLLVTMAAWMVCDKAARTRFLTPGPWLGLVTFAILLAPLVHWLFANDFVPLHYAALRFAGGRHGGPYKFILNTALNLLGVGAMLGVAGLIKPRQESGESFAPEDAAVHPRAIPYLAALTAGPLAITIGGALLVGTSLKPAWASPMFNFAGLLAIALTAPRFGTRALQRIAASAAILLTVVPIGYALIVLAVPERHGTHMRVRWPQAEISRRMEAIWVQRTGQPLRIVSGDDWIAGLIGVSANCQPSLLNRGERALSPWIDAERLQRQGMLIVWDVNKDWIPPSLVPLVAARPQGQEHFLWPGAAAGGLTIGYVIVAPNVATP
jgi:4-amino-4-deoxy-L-arabinose transferase-like glycosyltransferase